MHIGQSTCQCSEINMTMYCNLWKCNFNATHVSHQGIAYNTKKVICLLFVYLNVTLLLTVILFPRKRHKMWRHQRKERCLVTKTYPLKTREEVSVLLQFPLGSYSTSREFCASFAVRTEEQADVQAFQSEALQIKSEYGLRING